MEEMPLVVMPGGRWQRSRNAGVQSVALTQDPGNLPQLDSKMVATPLESARTLAAKANQAKMFGS